MYALGALPTWGTHGPTPPGASCPWPGTHTQVPPQLPCDVFRPVMCLKTSGKPAVGPSSSHLLCCCAPPHTSLSTAAAGESSASGNSGASPGSTWQQQQGGLVVRRRRACAHTRRCSCGVLTTCARQPTVSCRWFNPPGCLTWQQQPDCCDVALRPLPPDALLRLAPPPSLPPAPHLAELQGCRRHRGAAEAQLVEGHHQHLQLLRREAPLVVGDVGVGHSCTGGQRGQ